MHFSIAEPTASGSTVSGNSLGGAIVIHQRVRSVVTNAGYYRGLAEDCLFAAGQSSAKDVRDACMKDAAHFRALAERIERRSKTDKREQSEH